MPTIVSNRVSFNLTLFPAMLLRGLMYMKYFLRHTELRLKIMWKESVEIDYYLTLGDVDDNVNIS